MSPGSELPAADPLAAGREALTRGEWEAARACFEAALAAGESAEAIEALAMAAWWLDDARFTIDSRERAYRLHREHGDVVGAARMAIWLAWDYLAFRGEPAVASGWLQRAHRLLDDIGPVAEHGWLAIREAEIAFLLDNDVAAALRLARSARAIGRSLGEGDIELSALALEGMALASEGKVAEGMRLLDEASAAAVAGEIALRGRPRLARDVARSGGGVRGGDARVRREPARHGVRGGRSPGRAAPPPGPARGGQRALPRGRVPPLRPARAGRSRPRRRRDAALAAELAERFLRQLGPENRLQRVAGLELLVRALVALSDRERAQAVLSELQALVAEVGTDPLRASALAAEGAVAAGEGDPETARLSYEDAIDLFQRIGAPFETARARIELARVMMALERQDAAAQQARTAHEAMRAMRAEREAERAATLLRELDGGRSGHDPDAA